MHFYWTGRRWCLFSLDSKESGFQDMSTNTIVPGHSQLCMAMDLASLGLLQPAEKGTGGSIKIRDQAMWHQNYLKKGAKENENKHLGKAVLTCGETDDDA